MTVVTVSPPAPLAVRPPTIGSDVSSRWTLSTQVQCHGHYIPPRVPGTTPLWVLAAVPWLMEVSLWAPTLRSRGSGGGGTPLLESEDLHRLLGLFCVGGLSLLPII